MSFPTIEYNDSDHSYKIGGDPVPSVTQILGELTDKSGALAWWGMRVGMAAVIRLLQMEKLSSMALLTYEYDDHLSGTPKKGQAIKRKGKDKTPLEALVIENRLSTNHVRDAKADIGTIIHNALEQVGITGKLPSLGDFEDDFHGYLRAFAQFWLDQDPIMRQQEAIVGSVEHQFAGRFDLDCLIGDDSCLLDYKTSGGVYDSYSEQLAFYELGWTEMGNDPHDRLAIVHLAPDGSY